MVYFGHQVSPAPGKRDDLVDANTRFNNVIETHGGKAIASFQVAIGQGDGNLIYLIAHDDMAAASAAGEALENDPGYQAIRKATAPMIASVSSSLLQPLPESEPQ
jgi:hypothetical protein